MRFGSTTQSLPGDSYGDGNFDQHDIVLVLQAGKHNNGKLEEFSEGDWNRDGTFDQLDIVTALQSAQYLVD